MNFFKVAFLLFVVYCKESTGQQCSGNNNNNVRIVGGVIANQGSWPSIALIIWNYKGTYRLPTGVTVTVTAGSVRCDGTLISTARVLTAAHCIPTSVRFSYGGVTYIGPVAANSYYPTIGSMYSVYLGLYDRTSILAGGTCSAPCVKAPVSKVVTNSGFNSNTLVNDIALLHLTSPVALSNNIQLACLPASSTTYPGTSGFVYAVGWGLLSTNGASPNKLYNVKLSLYPASYCPYSGFDTNNQICAGMFTGGKGVCNGDAGGPLYYLDTAQNKYFIVGITSIRSSNGCGASGNQQQGFTRVSNYLSWINSYLFSSKQALLPEKPKSVLETFAEIRVPIISGNVVA